VKSDAIWVSGPQGNWIPICEKLEQTMEREKQLCANVDLLRAPVFTMLGSRRN